MTAVLAAAGAVLVMISVVDAVVTTLAGPLPRHVVHHLPHLGRVGSGGRRSLARSIALSGMSGVEIVRTHWTGRAVSGEWDSLAQTLTGQLLQLTQQHLAYPVLHHFHAAEPASSAPRMVAALDDAVLLMSEGITKEVRPSSDALARLVRAIDHYADAVSGTRSGDSEPPGAPSLADLREHAIPTVPDEEYASAAAGHAARRRTLQRLVTADEWTWPPAG